MVGLLTTAHPLKRLATISVPDGAAPLVALAERGPDLEVNRRFQPLQGPTASRTGPTRR